MRHLPALPIALAPMEGVTNFPMRAWLHLAAAPAALATPFLRVTATFPNARGLPPGFVPELVELPSGERPYAVVPQMMATEPDDFLRAADLFLTRGAPFVELNAGCPSPTCVGKGAGSSLLQDPDDFHAFVRRLAAALGPERVAVKMRTGFAGDDELPRLVSGLAPLPLARVTVHGRTRPAGYKGLARWDLIEHTARLCRAPVYASGDVVDGASLAARLAQAPSVQGVLVGRGALRNPWVFQELRTGESVALTPRALLAAIAAYALLHELHAERADELVRLVRAGLLAAPCGTAAAAWEQVYRTAAAALGVAAPDLAAGPLEGTLALSRHTMGRAKLLWNYLRSSLPTAFFAPQLMRAADLGTLLAGIRRLAAPELEAPQPLRHEPGLDWLYSGSGRRAPEASEPQTACVAW